MKKTKQVWKKSDAIASDSSFGNGADGENRTHMGEPHAPQTCASTNSATSAWLAYKL